jgi:hypothetical protein
MQRGVVLESVFSLRRGEKSTICFDRGAAKCSMRAGTERALQNRRREY